MTFYIYYLEIPDEPPSTPDDLFFSEDGIECQTYLNAKNLIEEEEKIAVILNKEREPIAWYYGIEGWRHIH